MRCRTAILLHELPDGTRHFDWLVAVDDPARGLVRTWRCAQRPDLLAVGASVAVERLADHRPIYLEFEGDIAGNRGRVTRLASGWWEEIATPPVPREEPEMSIVWDGSPGVQRWAFRAGTARRLE